MYKKPSSRWFMLKALCAIPVVALTINAFATPTEIDPVEDFVVSLETKDVPVFNEPKTENLTTKAIPTDAEMHDDTPFAIHPVKDQYGRIIGFSHEGEPATGDFECTCEYVFINGHQATESELRNYQSLVQNSKWEILKSPNGTAKYNYKDKHGIICFTNIDDTPLFLLDGKVVELPTDFINKKKDHLDEDVLGQLLHISKEDIASVTVIKDGRATEIFGEKAKNGVISIETKAFQEQLKDTCTIGD